MTDLYPFLYKFNYFNKYLISYYLFLVVISAVGFTVTEYRWFWGYDILMYLGGLIVLKKLSETIFLSQYP